jgi:hypothetical protein
MTQLAATVVECRKAIRDGFLSIVSFGEKTGAGTLLYSPAELPVGSCVTIVRKDHGWSLAPRSEVP